jgi:hypothetical protein
MMQVFPALSISLGLGSGHSSPEIQVSYTARSSMTGFFHGSSLLPLSSPSTTPTAFLFLGLAKTVLTSGEPDACCDFCLEHLTLGSL